ncbi:MAG: hypothetical protein NTV06_07465 [candidate division Zixibacteria bacterium]|nr:hypothetical protein [candidate division Zixibacteria bacterium]
MKEVVNYYFDAHELKLARHTKELYRGTFMAPKGEGYMSMRKEAEQFARVTVKDCWHPYGLQGLNPERFVVVATRILRGEFVILELNHQGPGCSTGVGRFQMV